MSITTLGFDPARKPEQFWRLELGFGHESTQGIMADAVLLDPITPKVGGRGVAHQHILVLKGSGFKYSTDSSCKHVYVDKRKKIESLYLDVNGELDRPVLCSSLSAAACILNGNSKDGRNLWHLHIGAKDTGLTFDQAYDKNLRGELTLIAYVLSSGIQKADMLTSGD